MKKKDRKAMHADAFWESLRHRERLPGELPYPSLSRRLARALLRRRQPGGGLLWFVALPALCGAVIGLAYLL